MNTISSIDCYYLRASRTIETVLVSNYTKEKQFYIYNYEGNSFRVFHNILNLIEFLKNSFETENHFENEELLDSYLLDFQL